MIRRLVALVTLSGSTFTMCAQGAVPDGCCEPGDTLNIVGYNQVQCDLAGGRLDGVVCVDVDF